MSQPLSGWDWAGIAVLGVAAAFAVGYVVTDQQPEARRHRAIHKRLAHAARVRTMYRVTYKEGRKRVTDSQYFDTKEEAREYINETLSPRRQPRIVKA